MAADGVVLSVVAPFYNECDLILDFIRQLRDVLQGLDLTYEVVLVDDGSTDGSFEMVGTFEWHELRTVRLVRNVGHQTALEVGLRESSGAFVITLDSDLQHPPSIIPRLLEAVQRNNVDVVYAVRSERGEDTAFKRLSARLYYQVMRSITGLAIQDNAADFRLMTRFAVDIVNGMPERKVYRLLLPALGFRSTTVEYVADVRRGGETKYTFRRMFALAVLSSVQFSRHPLRLVTGIGVVTSGLAFLWLVYVFISFLSGNTSVGWPSLMSIMLLLGGLMLFSLGVIGEYVGEIFDIVKHRPQYLIREVRRGD